ncbi:MAG: hypothetical protein ABS49_11430 [Erythrobacter sp. SCN 62-14]|nr:MAG: hypothetical protein ABS49_11430 [Erythrobacter sp. SCN 62-14]
MSLNVFQSSKSALIFAGSVIVTTLVLVGPGEGNGVLDTVSKGYLGERERIAEGAAAASSELSAVQVQPAPQPPKPSAWDANPMVDHNLGANPFANHGPGNSYGTSGGYGGSPQYANPATAPLSPQAISSGGGGNDLADASEAPRGEAVVTSRYIKIEPK